MSKITQTGLPEYEKHITEAKLAIQRKANLEHKLEILKLKTKLVQEELELLNFSLGHKPSIVPTTVN